MLQCAIVNGIVKNSKDKKKVRSTAVNLTSFRNDTSDYFLFTGKTSVITLFSLS